MKPFNHMVLILLWVIISIFGLGNNVIAADTGGGWRATYDLVLRWVNFVILAALIFKVAKTPLKEFLTGQKEKFSREIRRKEEEKEATVKEIKEIREALNEAEIRFASIKERIIEQGEKRKQRAIEDAKEQSRLIMEDAKRRIKGQILQAKQRFKSELIESAIDLALERIPQEITEEDNQKYIDQFLASTAAK